MMFSICNSCSYSRQTGLKSIKKAVRKELFVLLNSSAHLHLNSGNSPFLFYFILFNSDFSAVVQTRQGAAECSQNGFKIVTFTNKKQLHDLYSIFVGDLLINMDPPSPTWVSFLGNVILIIHAGNKLFFPRVQQLF